MGAYTRGANLWIYGNGSRIYGNDSRIYGNVQSLDSAERLFQYFTPLNEKNFWPFTALNDATSHQ